MNLKNKDFNLIKNNIAKMKNLIIIDKKFKYYY